MAVWLSGVKTLNVYTPLMHFLSGELRSIPYRQENLLKREMERVHWKAFLLLCQQIFRVNKEALKSITWASQNCDLLMRPRKSVEKNNTDSFSAVSSLTSDVKTWRSDNSVLWTGRLKANTACLVFDLYIYITGLSSFTVSAVLVIYAARTSFFFNFK